MGAGSGKVGAGSGKVRPEGAWVIIFEELTEHESPQFCCVSWLFPLFPLYTFPYISLRNPVFNVKQVPHCSVVEIKFYTKEEYVTLIPSVSTADFERLKKSIQEEGGLLMPIILNQDNVVLDGHHRLRACKELGLSVSYTTKDFTNRPLEELRYVVSVTLHRRHLYEFQWAEIGLKMDKLIRQIAKERQDKTHFTPDTAREAAGIRYMPSASRDAQGIGDGQEQDLEMEEKGKAYEPLKSSQQIADEVGVSAQSEDNTGGWQRGTNRKVAQQE